MTTTTASAAVYAAFQADNPENDFNDDLIYWRERDDVAGYLEDIFAALEVVPGITFRGVTIEKDESRFPKELRYNDIETSRLDLAQVNFTLELQENRKDITLSIFLPKLIDGLFYQLNGNLYYPILQLVDRGTYVTKKTFTLKTLLMPLVFRRDTFATAQDAATGEEFTDLIFTLDLFRNRINVLKYCMASKGLAGTLQFFGMDGHVTVATADAEAVTSKPAGTLRLYPVTGAAGMVVAAERAWIEQNPFFHGALVATLANALASVQRRAIEEDDVAQWRRRLGKHFTQNSNGYEEKAEKILVSLERILDRRTKKNLSEVTAEDKEDVYAILRWMMRGYRELTGLDSMDIRNKRIRVAEYLIHPLLLKFSESTYRLLNSKNLTFKGLLGVFKPFIYEEDGKSRPQANFLIKKLVTNELLRYVNLVNSLDLLIALRWTMRGPQSQSDRGKSDISLRFRGHHPSYVGRIGLSASPAGDPGVSGVLCPYAATRGQFFV